MVAINPRMDRYKYAELLLEQGVGAICGGFPCQDISTAGKGAGLSGTRSGLWRQMVRTIRLVRPAFAIVENVAALLSRGMGTVLGDLAEGGYDTEWHCISAADIGAPHLRERIWIVAHTESIGHGQWRKERNIHKENGRPFGSLRTEFERTSQESKDAANAQYGRISIRRGTEHPSEELRELSGISGNDISCSSIQEREILADADREHSGASQPGETQEWPTTQVSSTGEQSKIMAHSTRTKRKRKCAIQSGKQGGSSDSGKALPIAAGLGLQGQGQSFESGNSTLVGAWKATQLIDGCIGSVWAIEPNVGRVANGVPARVDRLKGLGNAVVPQIPYIIGKTIMQRESEAVSA